MAAMSKNDPMSAQALADLRQSLVDNNPIDRRVVSAEIFATAYNNPRSARPLLHLLGTNGRLGKRQLGRVMGLQEVLTSDPDL
jgi:hypothetical protein